MIKYFIVRHNDKETNTHPGPGKQTSNDKQAKNMLKPKTRKPLNIPVSLGLLKMYFESKINIFLA